MHSGYLSDSITCNRVNSHVSRISTSGCWVSNWRRARELLTAILQYTTAAKAITMLLTIERNEILWRMCVYCVIQIIIYIEQRIYIIISLLSFSCITIQILTAAIFLWNIDWSIHTFYTWPLYMYMQNRRKISIFI